MLLSAVSFLVVAQSSSEVSEGLMNNPVLCAFFLLAGSQLLSCLPSALRDVQSRWKVIVVSPQAIVEGQLPSQLSNR